MRFLLLTMVVIGALAGVARSLWSPPTDGPWSDVAARSGLTATISAGGVDKTRLRETIGQGACWLDFDNDGDADLFLPNAPVADDRETARWYLYRNDGGRFLDRGRELGLPEGRWGVGCAVGDADGDGYDDLYVTTAGGSSRLLINRQGRAFVDESAERGAEVDGFTADAAFGDIDLDGDLDLYVTRYVDESSPPPGPCRWKGMEVTCGPKGFPEMPGALLVNDGAGYFREGSAGLPEPAPSGFGLSVVFFDADDDGDPDLYVANDSSPNHLLLNRGDGSFEEAGFLSGAALSDSGKTQAGMGVEAADLDGDGRLDLLVTNFSDDVHNFYRNEGQGFFADRSGASNLAALSYSRLGWSALAEDFDLDGDLDLFLANGHVYPQVERADPATTYRQRPQLLFNDGRGSFSEDPSFQDELEPALGRGGAVADFDGDGRVDVLMVRDGALPALFQNRLAPLDSHWLRLSARGCAASSRCLGSRATLVQGERRFVRQLIASRGYLSSSEPVLTFGLSRAVTVESLEVEWPCRERTRYVQLPADRVIVAQATCG